MSSLNGTLVLTETTGAGVVTITGGFSAVTDQGTYWTFTNADVFFTGNSGAIANGKQFYVEFIPGGASGSSGTSGSSGSSGTSGVANILNNVDNRVLTATGTQGEANAEANLTFDGSTLTVTGGLSVTGNTTLGNAATDTVSFSADIATDILPETSPGLSIGDASNRWEGYFNTLSATLGTGTGNNVVILNPSNELKIDTIDSRVWGTSLVDGANGANNRVATFSDANSLNGESGLTFDGTTLTVTGNTSITGNTTLGNASGDSVTLNAGAITATNSDKTITRNSRKFLIRDDSDNYFGSVGSSAALTPQSSVPANFFGINGGSSHNTAVEIQVQAGADSATYKALDVRDSSGTVLADILSDGTFNALIKNFDIKHPTKEGWRLKHSVLEGPEAGVYIRGKVTGEGIIELPDYWTGLVHEDHAYITLFLKIFHKLKLDVNVAKLTLTTTSTQKEKM